MRWLLRRLNHYYHVRVCCVDTRIGWCGGERAQSEWDRHYKLAPFPRLQAARRPFVHIDPRLTRVGLHPPLHVHTRARYSRRCGRCRHCCRTCADAAAAGLSWRHGDPGLDSVSERIVSWSVLAGPLGVTCPADREGRSPRRLAVSARGAPRRPRERRARKRSSAASLSGRVSEVFVRCCS